MKKIMSIFVAALLILTFNSVSLAAILGTSSTPSAGAVVSDVLVLRPLGREKVIVIGPLEATQEVRKTIPLPPVWGGPLLAVGVILVIIGVKRP